MTSTLIPATERQISYLTDLMNTRQMDEARRADLLTSIDAGILDKERASQEISAALALPRLRKGLEPTSLELVLSRIPKSRYAVPVEEIELTDADKEFRGDLMFLEVRQYMGTLYMRQLIGSVGGFTRAKLSTATVKALVAIIERDPYKYAKIFGVHHSCCGSCGAELTDQKSRELQLGPECRKKFSY
jgi:hypothetical protein